MPVRLAMRALYKMFTMNMPCLSNYDTATTNGTDNPMLNRSPI